MTISARCIPKFFHHLTSHLPPLWQRDCGTLRPAQVLFTLMMVATRQNQGYKLVIDELKRSVGDELGWENAPTTSSFCEARRKLSVDQCRGALSFIRTKCTALKRRKRVLYGDYRLIAVDMTKLALPAYEDVRSVFGCPKDAKRRTAAAPQGTLTVMWDISTNTPIDWALEKVYSSERLAAQGFMHHLGAKDLLIVDRGYPSRQFFQDVAQQSAAYLVRMPIGSRGGFKEVYEFSRDKHAWDRVIHLHADNKKTGKPTVAVRLFKVKLPSGDIAIFATNLLNKKLHRRKSLGALYCYRWDLETAFREMKVWYGLENFAARYADGIQQEVAALMIFMQLTAELEAQALDYHDIETKKTDEGNHPLVPEFRFNRRYLCVCVGYLMAAAAEGPAKLAEMYNYAMSQLWRYRQRRKPGRTFERIAKSPNSKWKRSTYNTKAKAKKIRGKSNKLAE
jgi:Transposase DDE domain